MNRLFTVAVAACALGAVGQAQAAASGSSDPDASGYGGDDVEFQYLGATNEDVFIDTITAERPVERDGLRVFFATDNPPLPLIEQGSCLRTTDKRCTTLSQSATLALLGLGLAGLAFARRRAH